MDTLKDNLVAFQTDNILSDKSAETFFNDHRVSLSPNIFTESEYINTKEVINHADIVSESSSIARPETIIKYIPKWKEIFPWLAWSQEENNLYCLHCRRILEKYFPSDIKKGNVVSSNEIFCISKALRKHHGSVAHSAGIYIYLYDEFKVFISLSKKCYTEMKHDSEVIDTLKTIFDYAKMDKNSFEITIKGVGTYIEKILLDSLEKSKYFSVVADQCRGIIILRWLSDMGKWEEHVLWSYVIVWDMSPISYLEMLGIDYDKCTIYVANQLCRQCARCDKSEISQGALPPRPPSPTTFTSLLWDLDFLKPLQSLVASIVKIWRAYPYKFSSTFNADHVKALSNYLSNPTHLIPMLENIDSIKRIGLEVYESRAHVEALGLAMIGIEKDEKQLFVLTLLEEIIILLSAVATSTKITDQQIVKLTQAFNSLKLWSNGVSFMKIQSSAKPSLVKRAINDKVLEFIQFVEKFIDENQKSVYYNGREKIYAFNSLCSSHCLTDPQSNSVDEQKLRRCFELVFALATRSAAKPNLSEKESTYLSVKSFHNDILLKKTNVNNCIDVVRSFRDNPHYVASFPEAFELFQFCASMPFLISDLNKSLFESFVLEQRMESGIWANFSKDVKPSLLYLQHELHTVSHSNILKWWFSLDH